MSNTATALGEKLQRGGFIPREVRFSIAIAEFLNNGGTVERAHEMIAVAASKLPGEAITAVSQGQMSTASARQPNGDAGQRYSAGKADSYLHASPQNDVAGLARSADEADGRLPASSPHRDGEGHSHRASEGHAGPARPVREPSALQRKVMGHVAKVAAGVSLETYRVRDGRLLLKVKRGELRSLAATNRNEAMLLEMLRLYLDHNHPGGDMLAEVGELIDIADAKRLFDKSKEMADAA